MEHEPVPDVAGIVLAAGLGRRFDPTGRSLKLLRPLPGDTVSLVRRVCLNALQALDSVWLVCGCHEALLREDLAGLPLHWVVEPDAEAGMGASLKAGIRASCDAKSGWLVMLADMPWVQAQTYRQVALALAQGADLARPLHQGRPGHPVGFGRDLLQELLALPDREGARALIQAQAHRLCPVPTSDRGVLLDVDRPEDLLQGRAAP